jgi:DNA-binding winged helix-turn-helix (wHTH) protein/tetratricopeptide (TPR) repeat protein
MNVDDDEIRVGEIVVSPRARRLVAGGREIAATSREFELFAVLASHPGWVCSAEQLCDTAPESYSSPGAVNVHISHLRRKLALAGFPDVIETVRGAGYRVRAVPGVARRAERSLFVGRVPELAALAGAVADAHAGRGRFLLITGEVGAGKSSLVEQALADARREETVVAHAVCDADGPRRYWLWRQLITSLAPDAAGRPDLQTLWRLVTEGEDASTQVSARHPATADDVHDTVMSFLGSACSGPGAVVLFADNVQWADEPSLRLLGHVIRNLDGLHLLVLATCRDEDLGTVDRLASFVADACDSAGSQHVALQGLDLAGVVQIAENELGERGRDVAARIHAATGGNPLFVRELLRAHADVAEGPGGRDALARLPATIDALVRARIEDLPAETKRVLETAAVVGVEFEADVVGRACGCDGGVIEALAPALASFFVVETGTPGRFGFRHPLFRQALYESLPVPEREAIHTAVLDAIRMSARSRPRRVFELAHHASLAGVDLSRVALGCLAAAERESYRTRGYGEASKYARRALLSLDATALAPETATRVRAVLLERLGESRSAEGDARGALASYRAAIGERKSDDDAALARLHTRVAAVDLDLAELDESRAALDVADRYLESTPVRSEAWWSDWIHARLQRAEYEFVAATAGGTALDPALAEAVAAHGSPSQHVSFLEKRAAALWRQARYGPCIECVDAAREAVAVATSRQADNAHARAVGTLGGILVWRRELEEAEEVLERALTLVGGCQDPIAEARVQFFRVVAARFANNVARTEARARELLARSSAFPSGEFAAAANGCLAWVALRGNACDTAAGLARESMRALCSVRGFPHVWVAAWPLATCALAAGRLEEASSCAAAMLDDRQERLPDVVASLLRNGLRWRGAGDPVSALMSYSDAASRAALLGYA